MRRAPKLRRARSQAPDRRRRRRRAGLACRDWRTGRSGVGPFIAAGPIVAALSGAAVGAAVGGVAGALIGLGIPENEAKRYEGKVKAGNILLSVHTETSEETARAKDIFTKAGAQDICTTGEASTPKDSRAAHRESHPAYALGATCCTNRAGSMSR